MNHFKLSEREVVVWLEISLWSFRGGNAVRALSRKTPVPTAGSCWFLMHLKPSPPTYQRPPSVLVGENEEEHQRKTQLQIRKQRKEEALQVALNLEATFPARRWTHHRTAEALHAVGAVRDENLGGSEEWQITIWWWVNDTIMKTKHLTQICCSAALCEWASLQRFVYRTAYRLRGCWGSAQLHITHHQHRRRLRNKWWAWKKTHRSHRLVRNTRVVVTQTGRAPTHPQLWMPLNGIIIY